MLLGNKRMQRIVVGVIIGVVVISLALSLVAASAATAAAASGQPRTAAASIDTAAGVVAGGTVVAEGETPTPAPGLIGTSGDPKPVTKTPQGTSTQVNDKEHIGGLIAFLAFMLGGVGLLLRSKRRERRAHEAQPILS